MHATQVLLAFWKFKFAQASIQASKVAVFTDVISIVGPGISIPHNLRNWLVLDAPF